MMTFRKSNFLISLEARENLFVLAGLDRYFYRNFKMLQVVLKLELYLETNVEKPNWGFAKLFIKISRKMKAAFSFHQTF